MMTKDENIAVNRKPIKEEIFDVLHERIIAGNYTPGEWLRQDDISSQMGVSMTPVREALDLLVSAGLAERVPYRGVRVLQPTPEEIADSYALRLLLECSAVYAAATLISDDVLKKLTDLLEQSKLHVNLKDMSRQRVLSRELHELIISACGNSLLHKMYITILNTFPDWMLYEYMFRHPEMLDASVTSEYDEHRLIIDALIDHNPNLAVRRTFDHIRNRRCELESHLNVPAELLRQKEAQVLPMLEKFLK